MRQKCRMCMPWSGNLTLCHGNCLEGTEGCERQMLRFGSEETLGYEEAFPISCVVIRPSAPKFAEELTHRDFLGALMNLGIERDVLGDIIVRDAVGYVFCEDAMADLSGKKHHTGAAHRP